MLPPPIVPQSPQHRHRCIQLRVITLAATVLVQDRDLQYLKGELSFASLDLFVSSVCLAAVPSSEHAPGRIVP